MILLFCNFLSSIVLCKLSVAAWNPVYFFPQNEEYPNMLQNLDLMLYMFRVIEKYVSSFLLTNILVDPNFWGGYFSNNFLSVLLLF